jgi:hypothetical protein
MHSKIKYPKRAANALIGTVDSGLWKTVAYLSRASEEMKASLLQRRLSTAV